MAVEPATPAAPQTPNVVIVGGGFAGLYAARCLARLPVRVTLVDRRNYHLFQPLLYQVATAGLSPGDIASPIRSVLRGRPNVHVMLAEVTGIELGARTVRLADGELRYDYLLIATGASHSYFGRDEWAPLAPGLKSIDDALEIRRRILLAYEAAERETDPARQRALLTFTVVGGGPTGVELAGAIAEIARLTLRHDFRRIDPAQSRVVLAEAGPRILPAFPESLSASAVRQLEGLGVEVRAGAAVTGIDEDGVDLGDERLESRTVLWAAGVAAAPLARTLGVPLDRTGRVMVEPDLSLPGHPEVFVAGDLASFAHGLQRPLPGVAPVAIQMGEHVAENVRRLLAGERARSFHYVNRGNMATIGRSAAVADFGRLRLSGLPAWLAWVFVHILFLIGFANRLVVMVRWAWLYVTYQRGARLITGAEPPGRALTGPGQSGSAGPPEPPGPTGPAAA